MTLDTSPACTAPVVAPRTVPVATRPVGPAPESTVPTTRRPPPPIPRGREYHTVAYVIETADDGPWIVFDFMTSLPPQVAFGIPLASWDWNRVEGEESAGGTTWTNHTVELVGTWDGAAFALTEGPTLDSSA